MTLTEYKNLFNALNVAIKTTFITPVAGSSEILDRIITQAVFDNTGNGERQFYANLRRDNDTVDLWMYNTLNRVGLSGGQTGGTYSTQKPLSIVIQYYTDYRTGTTASNTEKDFDTKILELDYRLERNRRVVIDSDSESYIFETESFIIAKQRPIIADGALHRLNCSIEGRLKELVIGVD